MLHSRFISKKIKYKSYHVKRANFKLTGNSKGWREWGWVRKEPLYAAVGDAEQCSLRGSQDEGTAESLQ